MSPAAQMPSGKALGPFHFVDQLFGRDPDAHCETASLRSDQGLTPGLFDGVHERGFALSEGRVFG